MDTDDTTPDGIAAICPIDPDETLTDPACPSGRRRSSERMQAIRPVCTRCGATDRVLAVDWAQRITCAGGCKQETST